MRISVIALAVTLLSTPVIAAGPCVDCSHRGGKGLPIVATQPGGPVSHYSPYVGRRADGRMVGGKGYGITPEPHRAVCYTRECSPYTYQSMQSLDGGHAGQVGHTGIR